MSADIREAFEHWYSDGGRSPRAVARIGGQYELMHAQHAWIAWQACWNQMNEACKRQERNAEFGRDVMELIMAAEEEEWSNQYFSRRVLDAVPAAIQPGQGEDHAV